MTRDQNAGFIIAKILKREGGVADVSDGKGVTRYGQTPDWLSQFGLTAPKTPTEAEANYRTWLVRTGLIGVCDQADVFADAVIDWAVHSGHVQAIRSLQRAVKARADGVFGPETQAAVDRCDRFGTACRVVAERVRFIGRILHDQPALHVFASGWANRQAELIEALAS